MQNISTECGLPVYTSCCGPSRTPVGRDATLTIDTEPKSPRHVEISLKTQSVHANLMILPMGPAQHLLERSCSFRPIGSVPSLPLRKEVDGRITPQVDGTRLPLDQTPFLNHSLTSSHPPRRSTHPSLFPLCFRVGVELCRVGMERVLVDGGGVTEGGLLLFHILA